MRIIPAIDLREGCCVRLLRGEFDQQTEYSRDPLAVAKRFESMGFRDLHVVDLDGARTGTQQNEDVIRELSTGTSFAIQLGGGIREASAIDSWLAAGVRRCVIGSVAVTDPGRVAGWLSRFGGDRIVLALDVRPGANGEPMLATHGWTQDSETSLWDALDAYGHAGLRHVLCTDISRDGAMSGPSVDLYREFIGRYPALDLQASGGVRDVRDLEVLRAAGAAAAISGRALLDGRISREEISSFLRAG